MNRIDELKELIADRRESDLNNPGVRLTREYEEQCRADELELAELLDESERTDYQKYILIAEHISTACRTKEQKSIVAMYEGEEED